jgi:hypothetical protein
LRLVSQPGGGLDDLARGAQDVVFEVLEQDPGGQEEVLEPPGVGNGAEGAAEAEAVEAAENALILSRCRWINEFMVLLLGQGMRSNITLLRQQHLFDSSLVAALPR